MVLILVSEWLNIYSFWPNRSVEDLKKCLDGRISLYLVIGFVNGGDGNLHPHG